MTVTVPRFKGVDRTSFDLPAPERELLEAMKATGNAKAKLHAACYFLRRRPLGGLARGLFLAGADSLGD